MRPRAVVRALLLFVLTAGLNSSLQAQKFTYPAAREDTIVDDYFGTKVPAPYRWMEDESSPELKEWIAAENSLTFGYLDQIPFRSKIKARLEQLLNYARYSVPTRRGEWYFYSKNDGLQNQSVVYKQKTLGGESTVVIDPNILSPDGTVALTGQTYAKDGKLLAYGLSSSGSDWQQIKVRNVVTGKDYDDVLQWCKFAGIAWAPDNRGFYYNRYPDPSTVPPDQQSYNNKVYWHTLGSPQSDDQLVYERPDAKELGFSPYMTDDAKYLVLFVWHGTDPKNRIYYRKAGSTGDFIRLLDAADASYNPIDNVGSTFYIQTDLDAPKGRIIAIDVDHPEKDHWREIVPESDDVLSSSTIVNNQLVLSYLHDVHHVLKIFTLEGTFVREIPLPTLGAVRGISGRREDTEMFFGFTSFLYPYTVFRYDFKEDKLSTLYAPTIDFDASAFETKQVFCTSKDGAKVPMFLTYKKGLQLDGSNPVLLYAYGGFDISLLPSFSSSRLVWLEHGGVYAVANLRGGGEYGEEWHKAGMLEKKQNVFDDFIAAGEWLVQNKYTNPSRLAIMGGSNGGLLVAACMLQRPDLYGAVICEVPVTDMLRYQRFTVGRFWTVEYGNAEASAEQFKYLYAYSPLHNVNKGVAYPATLITTADHDDRVVPAHSMKFAATLQAKDAGKNPILIRIETKAGHGGGKPITKIIDETTDIYSFLMFRFGMTF